MIDHFDYGDVTIDHNPSYKGAPHTFSGSRGDYFLHGIRLSDIFQAVSIALKRSSRDEAEFNSLPIDPEAVAQNLCVEVEKLMGIYPNIDLSPEEAAYESPTPRLDKLLCKEPVMKP